MVLRFVDAGFYSMPCIHAVLYIAHILISETVAQMCTNGNITFEWGKNWGKCTYNLSTKKKCNLKTVI